LCCLKEQPLRKPLVAFAFELVLFLVSHTISHLEEGGGIEPLPATNQYPWVQATLPAT
jgi:hypothetical protein